MPDWAAELVRYGPLGLFALAVCFAVWKLGVYAFHRTLDDGGLVSQWMAGEKEWRTALTERIEGQQEQCVAHVECIQSLTDSVRANGIVSQQSSDHLARLVQLHETGGDIGHAIRTIDSTHNGWKRVASTLCRGCREVIEQDKPACSEIVLRHCTEIERIIGEA